MIELTLKQLLAYCSPEKYLEQTLIIEAPWGLVRNIDGHTIQNFAVLAHMADSMNPRWSITMEAEVGHLVTPLEGAI